MSAKLRSLIGAFKYFQLCPNARPLRFVEAITMVKIEDLHVLNCDRAFVGQVDGQWTRLDVHYMCPLVSVLHATSRTSSAALT